MGLEFRKKGPGSTLQFASCRHKVACKPMISDKLTEQRRIATKEKRPEDPNIRQIRRGEKAAKENEKGELIR